ncbi:unnamed protein product [Rhizopus microsporus]
MNGHLLLPLPAASINTSRKRQHNEVLCHEGLNPDPSFGEHLVVNGFDVLDTFCAMMASLTAHKWKQSLEDNLILALASTSVSLIYSPYRLKAIPLASIKIPVSIQSLPALVAEAPAIFKVLDVFDRLCVRSACPNVINDRCAPTLPIDNIQQLFLESKSRKRQWVLKHRHN